MKRTVLAILGCMLIALPLAMPALAHDYRVGDILIAHPWSRATPPGARVGSGYLKIENKGGVPDRLIRVHMERASRVEIHEMTISAGVMQMRELPVGIVIPPGAIVELKPGGLHVMFMDLSAPLKHNDRLIGLLTFERAGTVSVEFVVEPIGTNPTPSNHSH